MGPPAWTYMSTMYLIRTSTPIATGAVTGSVRTPASSATASVRRAGSPAALKTAAPPTPHSETHGSAPTPVSASHPNVTHLALQTTIPAVIPAHPPV